MKPFRVECNSSDFVNGAILSQYVDEKWHLVACRSRILSETERNYEIHDKKLMAIMDLLADGAVPVVGMTHL